MAKDEGKAQLALQPLLWLFEYRPEKLLGLPVEELQKDAADKLLLAASLLWETDPSQSKRPGAAASQVNAAWLACLASLDFLGAAHRRSGSAHLTDFALNLWQMREMLDSLLNELRKSPAAAQLLQNLELSKRKKFDRFRSAGIRGLDMNAPRNRLVFRLLDEIDVLQVLWNDHVVQNANLSKAVRERIRGALHERVREIISLPPLSPKSASAYHRVGLAMLKDAVGVRDTGTGFTGHPAFKRNGEFYGLVNSTKTFAGALNDAWRAVAKRQKTSLG